jgi:outer membrane protein OmpA-like peptidoglycan-associated protein
VPPAELRIRTRFRQLVLRVGGAGAPAAGQPPADVAALLADLRFELQNGNPEVARALGQLRRALPGGLDAPARFGDGIGALSDSALLEAVRAGGLVLEEVRPPALPTDLLVDPEPEPEPFPTRELTFIGFELRDAAGKLVPSRFRLELPDGQVREGHTGPSARVRVDDLEPGGNAKLTLLDDGEADADDADDETEKPFFLVQLVDDVGQPLDGVELHFEVDGDTHSVTTAGGEARLEDIPGDAARVVLADPDAVRDLVKPLWAETGRTPAVQEGAHTTVVQLGDPPDDAVARPGVQLTVSIQPRVVRATLGGLLFDTDKTFLLPSAVRSSGGVRALPNLYADNDGSKLLIVGHADKAGDAAHNDKLSLDRADAIAAFLKDDVDGWMKWYDAGVPAGQRWGAREDQQMLGAMPDQADLFAAPDPVRRYQETRGLSVDGIIGPDTRRQLVTDYMALDGTALPDDIEATTHGGGENFPADATPDGAPDQANRRVELFFFDGTLGIQPPPPGKNSPAGSKQYPEWVARAGDPVDLGGLGSRVTFALEWSEDLINHLPDDTALTLAGGGAGGDPIPLSSAERDDGVARLSFGELDVSDVITLTAKAGDTELVLVNAALVGDLKNPLVWQHDLDELLKPEDPPDDGDGDLVASSEPPADAGPDPDPDPELLA